jgi:two-component system response regulator DesR
LRVRKALPTSNDEAVLLTWRGVTDPITIMIAEDNEDLRATMVSLLDAETDIRCVAETAELEDVSALAAATSPRVIILDIELKGRSSLNRLPQLKRELPAARFLVYSGHALPALIDAALAAGASEYVLKSGDPYELIDAVRRCALC